MVERKGAQNLIVSGTEGLSTHPVSYEKIANFEQNRYVYWYQFTFFYRDFSLPFFFTMKRKQKIKTEGGEQGKDKEQDEDEDAEQEQVPYV